MNRYLSVFGLAARSTLYKLIGVIAIMGAVQAGLFLYALNNADGSMLLEALIEKSKITIPFYAGFLFYCLILCGAATKNPSNTAITMHRLSIPERAANWITVIYNMMTLVIFLAAELGICLALAKVYLNSDVSGAYEHVLFTAFYRNDLLHSLLPLEDYVTLAADILFVIEISIIAVYAQQQGRHGKNGAIGAGGIGIAVAAFLQDSSNPDAIGPVVVGLFAIYAAVIISKGGAVDEDTDYNTSDDYRSQLAQQAEVESDTDTETV